MHVFFSSKNINGVSFCFEISYSVHCSKLLVWLCHWGFKFLVAVAPWIEKEIVVIKLQSFNIYLSFLVSKDNRVMTEIRGFVLLFKGCDILRQDWMPLTQKKPDWNIFFSGLILFCFFVFFCSGCLNWNLMLHPYFQEICTQREKIPLAFL